MRRSLLLRFPTLGISGAIAWLMICGCATTPKVPTSDIAVVSTQLPPLPDALGVAGPVAGLSSNALVVAGGANFPNGFPWEQGKKVWHEAAYVLPKGATNWISGLELPRPLAYAISLTTERGIFVGGGNNADGFYANCYLLTWAGDCFELETLPALPEPLANAAGARVGTMIVVAGGETSPDATNASPHVWVLNLDDSDAGWKPLPACPGAARTLAVAGSHGTDFYLIGGVSLSATPDGKPLRKYLKDAYAYNLATHEWRQLANAPRTIAAAPSPAAEDGDRLVVLGGDDGSRYGFKPVEQHPGFCAIPLVYDTKANTWTEGAALPAARATAPVVADDAGFIVPSGEVRPGVRSPEVWRHVIEKPGGNP